MPSFSKNQCIDLRKYKWLPNNKQHREKLLSIKFDSKLSFERHVSSLCKKTNQKLYALNRTVNYMNFFKQKALMKAFVISQLDCCPLVWMFPSRKLNHRISSIHERVLRVT